VRRFAIEHPRRFEHNSVGLILRDESGGAQQKRTK
jgi:hypothetical protein